MSNGLAKTSCKETTEAPGILSQNSETMYREIEQTENVARGHVEVIEILAYDATKEPRRHPLEKGETKGLIKKDKGGNILYVEIPREPYFCQDPEDALIFAENNPKARTETFTVQVRKSTAIQYIDSPRNMKQFKKMEVRND